MNPTKSDQNIEIKRALEKIKINILFLLEI